ncbi:MULTISPECIES: hypothetical protein [unclassified Streptomyces]|uniref:DUF7489 domain-containing protein n=1 Tax=unclassified Streptomyces TaxID=2593676 RepID=UPI001F2A783A|nr:MULTISPECIES: hypothetical protein [unclassified Streptomyces]MCF0086118.1 hypothetical protein [Streptomyces sp. MH192]MCF0101318.1 hypothetical protein [Streptomyces sp. MH191]
MPDTVVLLLSVVPLAMVLMMIVSQRVGEVSDAYTGEITGRGVGSSTGTYGPTGRYVMHIRTDQGRELTIEVNGRTYQSLGVGDRVVKTAGARWPVRPE